MPIYVYHCPVCGDQEIFQSNREPLTACPDCCTTTEEGFYRRILPVAVIFKGKGWVGRTSRNKILSQPYHSPDIGEQPAVMIDQSDPDNPPTELDDEGIRHYMNHATKTSEPRREA